LFKLIEAAAASESEFRAFLPDAADRAALKEHLARLSRLVDGLINAPSFAIDIQNHQRGFIASPPGFDLPVQVRPQFYSPVKRGQVVRRRDGFVAIFDGSQVSVGGTNAAVAWLLKQRIFSFDDLIARHPSVDELELRAVLQQLLKMGAIVETEMR
jgi:hypothetical protein